jgi:hypothetical protein
VNVILFTGPSLPPDEALEILSARCLPPVSQGDVYRAALEGPDVIGIIDGYFRSVPSVCHKEILWALSQGVKVFGSASMGALRAAELVPFGMIGVGWVYEAFRDGILMDDDEVAVEHGPAELQYSCTSEAMVNIRRTFAAAEGHGVISEQTRLTLEDVAKAMYYPMRSYANILAECILNPAEAKALSNWLPEGKINQKRADAICMLEKIIEARSISEPQEAIAFLFEHTDMWEEVIRTPSPTASDSD